MKIKHILSSIIIGFCSLCLLACHKSPEVVTITGKTMGTTYSVKYIDDGQIKIKPIEMHGQIEEILKEVNNKMSTYISNI